MTIQLSADFVDPAVTAAASDRSRPKLQLVVGTGRLLQRGWHIELFPGGVRLRKIDVGSS